MASLSLQFGPGLLRFGLGGRERVGGLLCALDAGISQSFPERSLTSFSVGGVDILWRRRHCGCGYAGGESCWVQIAVEVARSCSSKEIRELTWVFVSDGFDEEKEKAGAGLTEQVQKAVEAGSIR